MEGAPWSGVLWALGIRDVSPPGPPCQSLWVPSPTGSTGLSMSLRPEPASAIFLRISRDLKASTPRDSDPGGRTQASTALNSYQFTFNLILRKTFSPQEKAAGLI